MNAQYGESKTTWIMMATVCHVTSGAGCTKFQAYWFLLNRVYHAGSKCEMHTKCWSGHLKRIHKMEELDWRLRVQWELWQMVRWCGLD